jgi:hypothetical protein
VEEQTPITGSCLCGGVQFEFTRALGPLELCHCPRCRKVSGSAFFAGLMISGEGFRLLEGQSLIRRFELPVREHPPGYATSFCGRCGSPVPDPPANAKAFELPAGLLDDDPGLTCNRHIFIEHQAPWFETTDDLPKLDRAALVKLRTRAYRAKRDP